jgi:hypothetical protein
MTLQKLLLKLSMNKGISVECFCSDGKFTITLKEWYSFNILLKETINLNENIDITKFIPYLFFNLNNNFKQIKNEFNKQK